jgi:hypothetical protein
MVGEAGEDVAFSIKLNYVELYCEKCELRRCFTLALRRAS